MIIITIKMYIGVIGIGVLESIIAGGSIVEGGICGNMIKRDFFRVFSCTTFCNRIDYP